MEPSIYDAMAARQHHFWWHRGKRFISASVLEKHLPKKNNLRILDAGCGTGAMFPMLKPFGTIVGIDKSPQAVEHAKKLGMAQVIEGDIEHLPFENESFDLALSSDVLYHRNVNDIQNAMREINRVLVPGGHFLVREAAYDWLRSENDRLVWTKHRFTKPEMISRLQNTGFEVVRASYINFFLFPLALTVRLSEKLQKVPKSQQSFFRVGPAMNSFLYSFLFVESKLIKHINFPFGLSILCLAKKKIIHRIMAALYLWTELLQETIVVDFAFERFFIV